MSSKDVAFVTVSVGAAVSGLAYGLWQRKQRHVDRQHFEEQKAFWQQAQETMRAVRDALDRENQTLDRLAEQVRELAV